MFKKSYIFLISDISLSLEHLFMRGQHEVVVDVSHRDNSIESGHNVPSVVDQKLLEVPGDVTTFNGVIKHHFLVAQHFLIRGTQILK